MFDKLIIGGWNKRWWKKLMGLKIESKSFEVNVNEDIYSYAISFI